MTEMRWLSEKGDTKLVFSPDNADEVKQAKKTYDDLVKKGFIAYRVDKDGDKNGKMTEFEKTAGRIILVPPLQGG